MSHLTTHILDTSCGSPAAGVAVTLERAEGTGWSSVASGVTNDDGRIGDLGPERLASGTYRLTFAVGDYFEGRGEPGFFPQVQVTFVVDADQEHYHVPLLLSPFGYSTYRGS